MQSFFSFKMLQRIVQRTLRRAVVRTTVQKRLSRLLSCQSRLCSLLFRRFWVLAVMSFLCFAPLANAMPLPIGSIHTYHEQPGQTTFRSKQSLRDRSDRSWQVILFKRYQTDDIQGLYLRLVGFPGMVSVNQDRPITIATGASMQWQAEPALDPQTSELPENAAQYDVAKAIADLAGDIPLQIDIPLGNGSTAQLVVPPFAVREWRNLNAQSPA